MTELVYSRRLATAPTFVEFLKEAFDATPLGLFLAAARQGRRAAR